MKICKHCIISGRVQGVSYRQATRERALQLGIRGWVRNCDNGDVEAFICGEEERIETLLQWLRQGPQRAKVDSLIATTAELMTYEEFTIVS